MDILQQRNQRRQVGGGAGAAASAAGGAAPAAAPRAAPAPAAPQQRGSGFVSFDRLLAANQAGAQAMAQRVGDRVQQAGQAATSAIQGGVDAFAKKAQEAGLGFDPTKATTSEQARVLSQAPTYTGPRAWSDANSGVDNAGINKAVSEGNAAVAQLQSQGGIANLLRESYNTRSTAGGSALDAALTGAAGGGRFQQLQQQFGGLDALLSNAAGGAGDVAKGVEASSKDNAAKYGALVEGLAAKERDAAQRAEWERQRQARADLPQAEQDDGVWSPEDEQALENIRSGGASRNRKPIGRR